MMNSLRGELLLSSSAACPATSDNVMGREVVGFFLRCVDVAARSARPVGSFYASNIWAPDPLSLSCPSLQPVGARGAQRSKEAFFKRERWPDLAQVSPFLSLR
jgi:hypothetical protein